jgi:cyclophilin family peptidyl-prolyl cis-trans isomerase
VNRLETEMNRYRCTLFLLTATLAGCSDRAVPPAAARSTTSVADVPETPVDKYDQPFAKATTDEVGPDQLPPVERTIAGKSAAKLRDEVELIWPSIKLIGVDQRPLAWVVTIETDVGTIEVALRSDLAPNHVRNLISLVKAGYYDGLRFDRIVHQQTETPEGARSEIRLVSFGCPAGTGDPGIGHIGYRLRSEFSEEKHVAGTVGFARDADPSSAGTRLYITLGPAPIRDGNYTVVGKVTKGLDVVEKIAAGKLLPEEVDPARELPERPIVIRKATAEYK